jgi:hypothetical protein
MECKKSSTMAKCTCTYEPCPRKGVCCECIEYHRRSNEVPGCLFSKAGERSYDRSASNFIRDRQKNQ